MKREYLITIKGEQETDLERQKGIVRPSENRKILARRNLQKTITFYDLAQVNTGTDAEPVWSDHPILKTPSITAVAAGSSGTFYRQDITVESFTQSDYQAFTDLLFQFPVTQWSKKYRKLEYEPYLTTATSNSDTSYPSFLVLKNNVGTWGAMMRANPTVTRFMADALYGTDAAAILAANGLVWSKTSSPYKGLPYLAGKETRTSASQVNSFFGFSTEDKISYKLTSVNDPNAPDVGIIAPSGKTEIYLIPHVSAWAACSSSADNLTKYVLGPVYQVNPREMFPRFVERGYSHATAGTLSAGYASNDPSSRKESYLEYQQNRAGMHAGSYSRSGTNDTANPFTNMTSNDPLLFPITSSYYAGTLTDNNATFYQRNAGDATRGNLYFISDWFENTDPFLTAVIKTGGRFYYCWSLEDTGSLSNNQGMKFRVSLNHLSSFFSSANFTDDTANFTL
jgi:hypothetical protein